MVAVDLSRRGISDLSVDASLDVCAFPVCDQTGLELCPRGWIVCRVVIKKDITSRFIS